MTAHTDTMITTQGMHHASRTAEAGALEKANQADIAAELEEKALQKEVNQLKDAHDTKRKGNNDAAVDLDKAEDDAYELIGTNQDKLD